VLPLSIIVKNSSIADQYLLNSSTNLFAFRQMMFRQLVTISTALKWPQPALRWSRPASVRILDTFMLPARSFVYRGNKGKSTSPAADAPKTAQSTVEQSKAAAEPAAPTAAVPTATSDAPASTSSTAGQPATPTVEGSEEDVPGLYRTKRVKPSAEGLSPTELRRLAFALGKLDSLPEVSLS